MRSTSFASRPLVILLLAAVGALSGGAAGAGAQAPTLVSYRPPVAQPWRLLPFRGAPDVPQRPAAANGVTAQPTTKGGGTKAAPAGYPGAGFSINGGFQNEGAGDMKRDLDTMQSAGGRWVRMDLNWAVIQANGPTTYNWAPFDAVATAATGRGMSVLAVLQYTPAWARPAGSPAQSPPTNADDYAKFARAAAAHYATLGVHTFEIWNEPNISAFWWPKPDVARYTRLLQLAATSIRSADPSATILTGGTAPAANDDTNVAPVTFLQGIYANGGKGSFDAVGHHPYCWPADPGDAYSWSAWYVMYGSTPSLRSVMVANGDGAKKIWATEYGAPTGGPAGSYVTEDAQSRMVTKAYALFRSYSWAGPLFWYSQRDLGTSTSTRENFFGLLRNDFSTKPSYLAYKTAVSG